MNEVASSLLKWHERIDRDLPWKTTVDPYFIWVSEIILQQTRVEQGTPYYYRFIEKFPTIYLLAAATQEEVYKVWEGLGYYSRARNMHTAAKQVVNEFNGEFPTSYDEIIKLQGIGPYTAAAISSFAFHEDRAVLDGNVFRVLSRLYDEDALISEAKNRKLYQEYVDNLLPLGKSAAFNQAIMDFGALVCKPKNPQCDTCILSIHCEALVSGKVHELPKKKKPKPKKHRYFYFLDLRPKGGAFPIMKRMDKDIWQGLYSFPFIDQAEPIQEISLEQWQQETQLQISEEPKLVWETTHILSHQLLHCFFYTAQENSIVQEPTSSYRNARYRWIEDVSTVAWPVVISKYLNLKET